MYSVATWSPALAGENSKTWGGPRQPSVMNFLVPENSLLFPSFQLPKWPCLFGSCAFRSSAWPWPSWSLLSPRRLSSCHLVCLPIHITKCKSKYFIVSYLMFLCVMVRGLHKLFMVFISLVSGNIFRILNITFLAATISELELRGLELMIFYGSLPLRRCNSETEFWNEDRCAFYKREKQKILF